MELENNIEQLSEQLKDAEEENLRAFSERITALAEDSTLSDEEFRHASGELRNEIAWFKKYFRSARSREMNNSIAADELITRLKEIEQYRKREKRRFRLLSPTPTNAQIDYEEQQLNHFTQGLTFYKLFWIFFIGSFAGVVIEMLWVVIVHGHFELRTGLIYGPFNLVYGIGAVALSVSLYHFRNRNRFFSFAGGFIAGSLVEYACSYFQELIFGSTSWDYSHLPFNINGRICLLYSIFWGLLGIVWIKDVYPRLVSLILKIPNRVGKALTWALLAFMIFNSAMSGFAVLRWSERIRDVPASTKLDQYFDAHYPNERMEKIYAGMVFVADGQEHDNSRFAR